jgi:hypothetical protein
MKMEHGIWEYNWKAYIQTPDPPGWGLDARLINLLCKKKYCFETQ